MTEKDCQIDVEKKCDNRTWLNWEKLEELKLVGEMLILDIFRPYPRTWSERKLANHPNIGKEIKLTISKINISKSWEYQAS
jgi:hypothetical protein